MEGLSGNVIGLLSGLNYTQFLFRSKADLQRFFDEQKLTHNMDNFDFSLDTPLKKIRQIWRSTLHQPDPVKPTSNGVKEVKEPDSSLDSRLQSDGLLKKSVKSPNSLKGQLKIDIPVASPTSHALSPTPAPVSVSSSSKINSVNSPCILKGNASETGQVTYNNNQSWNYISIIIFRV